jgi:large subunit ribosomal protein L15
MMSHEITSLVGKHKSRKRVGRGQGSGLGKTAGRGHNGQNSRAGSSTPLTFEGGQMPLFRRLPKRGFNNANFETKYQIVNVSDFDRFEDGATVNAETLKAKGLITSATDLVKILGTGEVTRKLTVMANKFSKSASKKIQGAGGSVEVVNISNKA